MENYGKLTKFVMNLKKNLDNKGALQFLYDWLTTKKLTTYSGHPVRNSTYDVRNPKGKVYRTKMRTLTIEELKQAKRDKKGRGITDRKRGVQMRRVQNYLDRKNR